jgi:large subunit ribosomal protein L29
MKKAINELRGMDSAELQAKLQELRKEQFGLRVRSSSEAVVKTTRFREIRRSIARILMVLGDRARAAAQQGASAEPASRQ